MIEGIQKAKDYESKRMWEEALIEYTLLLKKDKKDIYILDKIGWCQSRIGRYYEAANTYKSIIEMEPNKAKWHYSLGYQYNCLKQWSNAISSFENAIKYYPNYLIVYYRIAYAIKEDAVKSYGKSFPRLRESLRFLNIYESIYFKLDDRGQRNSKSDYIKVLFLKGKLLMDLDDINQSIEVLEKVYFLDKNNKDVAYSLSKAYYYNNEYNKVLELFPKMPNKYYSEELKAKTLSKQGDYDEALSRFSKVLKTRKKDYIYREVSIIHLQLDDLDKAYIAAKESLAIGKDNHKNIYLMGLIYYKYNLLILSQKMLLRSISVKKQKYNTDYKEAQELLQKVIYIIEKNSYEEDCKSILKHLESIVKENDISHKEGKIVKWIEDKGFGFVKDKSDSYFFHISDINKQVIKHIAVGMVVEFNLKNTHKGFNAIIVNIKTDNI